jgi:hypothetical protein
LDPKEKLNQDYIAFNQAIEKQAQQEIINLHACFEALKAQAARVSKAITQPQLSEKIN